MPLAFLPDVGVHTVGTSLALCGIFVGRRYNTHEGPVGVWCCARVCVWPLVLALVLMSGEPRRAGLKQNKKDVISRETTHKMLRAEGQGGQKHGERTTAWNVHRLYPVSKKPVRAQKTTT